MFDPTSFITCLTSHILGAFDGVWSHGTPTKIAQKAAAMSMIHTLKTKLRMTSRLKRKITSRWAEV